MWFALKFVYMKRWHSLDPPEAYLETPLLHPQSLYGRRLFARSYADVITKFPCLMGYQFLLPMVLRCALRAWKLRY